VPLIVAEIELLKLCINRYRDLELISLITAFLCLVLLLNVIIIGGILGSQILQYGAVREEFERYMYAAIILNSIISSVFVILGIFSRYKRMKLERQLENSLNSRSAQPRTVKHGSMYPHFLCLHTCKSVRASRWTFFSTNLGSILDSHLPEVSVQGCPGDSQ